MKVKMLLGLFLLGFYLHAKCQNSEMDKFYLYYKPGKESKQSCDSLYQLIEKRRTAFSKAFRSYKEAKGSLDGFIYDWSSDEKEILSSFQPGQNIYIKYILYYSYFDLGYGAYGLRLRSDICKKAMREIPASSVIWALEPSLLTPVILAAGGEDSNTTYIKQILKLNKDKNLFSYVKNNLSPERSLKKGKKLPVLQLVNLADTSTVLSSNTLIGKYYLIDIWATWCKPCIDEFPGLINVYNDFKNSNLDFVSISIDENSNMVKEFLHNKIPLPWQTCRAISRKELMKQLMIDGIPCTILINANGKILSYGNDLRGSKLAATLKSIIN